MWFLYWTIRKKSHGFGIQDLNFDVVSLYLNHVFDMVIILSHIYPCFVLKILHSVEVVYNKLDMPLFGLFFICRMCT